MAVLLEGCVALFLGRGSVVGDVGHVALFLVAVMAFHRAVIHSLLNLKQRNITLIDVRTQFGWTRGF